MYGNKNRGQILYCQNPAQFPSPSHMARRGRGGGQPQHQQGFQRAQGFFGRTPVTANPQPAPSYSNANTVPLGNNARFQRFSGANTNTTPNGDSGKLYGTSQSSTSHFYGHYEDQRNGSYLYTNFSGGVQVSNGNAQPDNVRSKQVYTGGRDNFDNGNATFEKSAHQYSQQGWQVQQQQNYNDTNQQGDHCYQQEDYPYQYQCEQSSQGQDDYHYQAHQTNQVQAAYEDYDNYYDSYEGESYCAKERRAEKMERRTRSYYCDTCNMNCESEQSYQAHLDGKTHKKKLAMAREAHQTQNKKTAAFHCQVCNVGCNTQEVFMAHLAGQKHQRAIKMMIKANKPIPDMEYSVILPSQANSDTSVSSASLEQDINAKLGIVPPQVRDDRHAQEKVEAIEMDAEQLGELEQLVLLVEDTLYAVSEFIEKERELVVGAQRLLRGIMRVGLLSKHLLLKSDRRVDLVVLCSVIPTSMLLYQIVELFRQFINKNSDANQYIYVAEKIQEAAICISKIGMPIDVYVTLTCSQMRQWSPGDLTYYPYVQPENALSKQPCLNALTEMRRTKFYQVKCEPHKSMNGVMKIIRDIQKRVPAWEVLSDWTIELIVEKALSASGNPQLGLSAALKAVFDAISDGIVLGKGTSLPDPCEKLPVDAIVTLKDRERDQLYSSARYAIKQIKTGRMVKLLALDGSPGIPSAVPPRKKARHNEDKHGEPKAAEAANKEGEGTREGSETTEIVFFP